MSNVVWFHFSDLHYRRQDQFNRNAVLTALWDDIAKQIDLGYLPHFIAVTGDLAFSGKADEYQQLEQEFLIPLLEKTSVPKNRFYFVPGNHDFDRAALEILNLETIRGLDTRDAVNTFLADSRKREAFLNAFSEYSSFIRRFTGASYFGNQPAYAYSDLFDVSGTTIEIVGLNTSWMCNYRNSNQGGDKGYLVVGEHQIRSVEDNRNHNPFSILLMHHPFDWLSEIENATNKRSILGRAKVIHHGHVHLASEVSHSHSSDHDCYVFGAAACYDRREGTARYANGYSIVSLDTIRGEILLRLRKYVDSPNPHWTSNEDVLGENSRGEHRFVLSKDSYEVSGQQEMRRFRSLEDVYRSVNGVLANIPTLRRTFGSYGHSYDQGGTSLLQVYEEAVTSVLQYHFRSLSYPYIRELVAAVLFNEIGLTLLASDSRSSNRITLAERIDVTQARAVELWGDVLGEELRHSAQCMRALTQNWSAVPHALTQNLDPAVSRIHATIGFLGVSLSCMKSLEFFQQCLERLPSLPDDSEFVALTIPKRVSAPSENVLEIVIPSANSSEFVLFSLLRYHLESRLERLSEAYASINQEFPLEVVKLQLLAHPRIWSEQRFTVDTPRIISLLMGSELYGEKSKDVWFRELFQNAVDACRSYKAIAGEVRANLQVTLTGNLSDRSFSIRDTGIGMLRTHVDRYLCRIGRSIWRSEELKQAFSEKHNPINISIGKFGIGFLAVFEVAEEVVVRSRHYTEDRGRELRISSPKDPFFVREDIAMPVGTEVILRFRTDYSLDPEAIAKKFIVYSPQDVAIGGMISLHVTPEDAMDNAIAEAKLGKDYIWYKSTEKVGALQASLLVAVPVPQKIIPTKDAPMPGNPRVIVTNGGIMIREVNSEWLGATKQYYPIPTSGVVGIRAILNFESGTAPVTISRNELQIADAQARQVIDAIVAAASAAWRQFARDLFEKNRDLAKATLLLVRLLNRCCKAPVRYSGRADAWADNAELEQAALDILNESGHVELCFQDSERKKVVLPLQGLSNQYPKVLVAPGDLTERPLFRLFWAQQPERPLIQVPDSRACSLFSALCETWTAVTSDAELWEVITINESKNWELRDAISAEAAIVPRDYFTDERVALLILPRRRARADAVVGYSRAKADNISPRVLLNQAHPAWLAIEKRLRKGDVSPGEIMDMSKMLFGLVVDEKSIGRRKNELRHIKERIAKLAGEKLPIDIVVEL